MLARHFSKQIRRADLNLCYTAGTLCLGSSLLDEICRRIADNNIKLILHNTAEGDGIVILRLCDIIFLIDSNVDSDVIIVTRLLSHSLKVVLKHIHELGIIFVTGDKNLTAILTSCADLFDNSGGKYACTCSGIKHCVRGLLFIKDEHIRHQTRGLLFGKESSKAHVFALGFRSYQLRCVSDGHI